MFVRSRATSHHSYLGGQKPSASSELGLCGLSCVLRGKAGKGSAASFGVSPALWLLGLTAFLPETVVGSEGQLWGSRQAERPEDHGQ